MSKFSYVTGLAKVNGTKGLMELRKQELIENISIIKNNFINKKYPVLVKYKTNIDRYGRWRKSELPEFIASVTNINELYKMLKFSHKDDTEEYEIKFCYNLDDILGHYKEVVANDDEYFIWKIDEGFIKYIPVSSINYKGRLNHFYPLGDDMLLVGQSGGDGKFKPIFVASKDKISGYSKPIDDLPHLKDIKDLFIINFNRYSRR